MGRAPRHDAPGKVHHVILRAVLGIAIFLDEIDRYEFLAMLANLVHKTGARCFAWALMSNHAHLMIETGSLEISKFVQRLASAFARSYNKRHGGKGHLFQGPFLSKHVDSEAYWLQLIRYIHLNPIDAGLVANLDELATYPWSGYATLMGNRPITFESTEPVLRWFGEDPDVARARLEDHMRGGLDAGNPYPLGDPTAKAAAVPARPEAPVDRDIREREVFIDRVLRDREETDRRHAELKRAGWDLERVIEVVCSRTGANREALRTGSRTADMSMARAIIAHLAVRDLGLSCAGVARALGVTRQAISKCLAHGFDLCRAAGIELE